MTQKYGYMANLEESVLQEVPKPCVVCDDPRPTYSWTDYSGEAFCIRCGTPYQLKWGKLRDGEAYPRPNVRSEAVPMLRRYFSETGRSWGGGTFLVLDEYPEVRQAIHSFNEWWLKHKDEYPELQRKEGA